MGEEWAGINVRGLKPTKFSDYFFFYYLLIHHKLKFEAIWIFRILLTRLKKIANGQK